MEDARTHAYTHVYTHTHTQISTNTYIYFFKINTPIKLDIGHNVYTIPNKYTNACVCVRTRACVIYGHNHGHENHKDPVDKHKTNRHTTLLWFIFSSRWARARARRRYVRTTDEGDRTDAAAEEGNTDSSPWGKKYTHAHLYYIFISNPVPDTDPYPLIIFCRHRQKSHRAVEYTKTIENVIVPLEKPLSVRAHTHTNI